MRRLPDLAPAVAAVILAAATASGAAAQTIDDALAAAYRSNPQLLSARAQLRALDEGVPLALSGWRPTVTLNGSLGKAYDTTRSRSNSTPGPGYVTTDLSRYRTPDTASLQVTQPLYRGGQTLAAVSQAENNVEAGR